MTLRELLRVSLWCLFAALAMNGMFMSGQAFAPKSIADAEWLHIRSVASPNERVNTPEHTVIYTTARPKVLQVAPSQWQITFSSRF